MVKDAPCSCSRARRVSTMSVFARVLDKLPYLRRVEAARNTFLIEPGVVRLQRDGQLAQRAEPKQGRCVVLCVDQFKVLVADPDPEMRPVKLNLDVAAEACEGAIVIVGVGCGPGHP